MLYRTKLKNLRCHINIINVYKVYGMGECFLFCMLHRHDVLYFEVKRKALKGNLWHNKTFEM